MFNLSNFLGSLQNDIASFCYTQLANGLQPLRGLRDKVAGSAAIVDVLDHHVGILNGLAQFG